MIRLPRCSKHFSLSLIFQYYFGFKMAKNPHYEADPKAIDRKVNGQQEELIVKPRGLNIVWGNDSRYWNVPGPDENGKPAELLQVSWLEVTGSVDTDPGKNYKVCFTVSLTPDAFGWGGSPIYIMVKRGKDGKFSWVKDSLTNSNGGTKEFDITRTLRSSGDSSDKKLYFGLYEVWSGKWKGGLRIHHVTIKETAV